MQLVLFNPELQDELEAFVQKMYECRGHLFDPITLQPDIRSIKETYQKNGGDFWVLHNSAHIMGSIALKIFDPIEDIGEIKRYFVHPSVQGQGLGHQLMTHAIEAAKRNRLKKLRLDTMKSSERALKIFKANGFYAIEKYNNNDIAEIFMEKDLWI